MINLHADTLTALQSDNFEYCQLVDIPGPFYLTNNDTDVTANGNTYDSTSGLLLSFNNITKDQKLKVGSYNLSLSNVNTAIANGYMAANYRGQDINVYLAIMQNGVVQGSPFVTYKGTLDTFQIRENKDSSILELKVTSRWASFNENAGRYTNDTLQQQLHTGDDFFKYSHNDVKNLGWGKS